MHRFRLSHIAPLVGLVCCSSNDDAAGTKPNGGESNDASSDAGNDAPVDTGTGTGNPGGKPRRVFVSSAAYSGNLGGLVGANAKCTTLASAAGLAGKWNAWLYSGTIATIPGWDQDALREWRRLDGVLVRSDVKEVIGGRLQAPISVTETGALLATDVWTGGPLNSKPVLHSCNGWTTSDAASVGSVGASDQTTSFDYSKEVPCSSEAHLYCVEE